MQTKILEKFIYSKDAVPKNYGKVFTLTEFNEKVKNYHCQSFMGMGYLIFDEKLVENIKSFVSLIIYNSSTSSKASLSLSLSPFSYCFITCCFCSKVRFTLEELESVRFKPSTLSVLLDFIDE